MNRLRVWVLRATALRVARSRANAVAFELGVATLLCLAAGSVGAQVPRDTRDYLRAFDTDGDSRVSLSEYQNYLTRGFVQMDRNADGILTADELPSGTRARKQPTLDRRQRELSAAFDRQDLNNDGYLDAREMAAPPQ